MSSTTQTIDVEVPISTAYNQYTQFEDFPRFMDGVKSVAQLDDTHLLWVAEIGGKTKEWTAEITDQQPDERISWRAQEGEENGGTITFHAVDEGVTRVTAEIFYEAEGIKETVGDVLGFMDSQVKGDLERFKEFIESRGSETGAWRGEVEAGSVLDNDGDSAGVAAVGTSSLRGLSSDGDSLAGGSSRVGPTAGTANSDSPAVGPDREKTPTL